MKQLQSISSVAFMASSSLLISIPLNFSASLTLGVVNIDFGSKYLLNASAMSSLVRFPPEVATITGSLARKH